MPVYPGAIQSCALRQPAIVEIRKDPVRGKRVYNHSYLGFQVGNPGKS
jgi:hypothetical protein